MDNLDIIYNRFLRYGIPTAVKYARNQLGWSIKEVFSIRIVFSKRKEIIKELLMGLIVANSINVKQSNRSLMIKLVDDLLQIFKNELEYIQVMLGFYDLVVDFFDNQSQLYETTVYKSAGSIQQLARQLWNFSNLPIETIKQLEIVWHEYYVHYCESAIDDIWILYQTNLECAICLESINDQIYTGDCKHQFHYACMAEWLKNNCACPLCKQCQCIH